jgi:hypothetical protein
MMVGIKQAKWLPVLAAGGVAEAATFTFVQPSRNVKATASIHRGRPIDHR